MTAVLQTPDATATDVDAAVARARSAQAAWAAIPGPERRLVLRRAARALEDRRDELVALVMAETGSVRAKAEGEVAASIEELHLAGALALHPSGELVPSARPGRTNIVERVPVGVVGLITGWNYPMHLGLRIAAPALALGNAVLVKPAPETPRSGGLAWADALTGAGSPVAVLPGRTAGPALVGHAGVDMIHFTGSSATGHAVAAAAARTLQRVALELGGNNATVVLADADVELAAACGVAGTFVHQGQVCIATGRHIVVREVAEAYTAAVTLAAAALRVGDPLTEDVDLGPLISDAQARRAAELVDGSVARGATVVAGGAPDGRHFPATVVTGVRPGMPLFDAETFAPVVAITVAEDEDEAVALANRSEYGLSAAVFTRDLDRGWALARRIRAGMVHVNDMTALHEPQVPFGGIGASGLGERFGGLASLDLFTERRWISLQRSV
ncbi:aldehyde dehydrogenase family protein [Pseudonocardia sp.]|uniref:aldehyde dehydrogenase family protein n=1 Tax=Pseudonocardia sp. TaxID=60912 RepID=UPI003D137695